jgi:hypothetical protein
VHLPPRISLAKARRVWQQRWGQKLACSCEQINHSGCLGPRPVHAELHIYTSRQLPQVYLAMDTACNLWTGMDRWSET